MTCLINTVYRSSKAAREALFFILIKFIIVKREAKMV